MTHYDIAYEAGYHESKHHKAITDIQDYMGLDKYVELTARLREEPQPPLKVWTGIYAPLTGIQGYPAQAWYAEIWPFG